MFWVGHRNSPYVYPMCRRGLLTRAQKVRFSPSKSQATEGAGVDQKGRVHAFYPFFHLFLYSLQQSGGMVTSHEHRNTFVEGTSHAHEAEGHPVRNRRVHHVRQGSRSAEHRGKTGTQGCQSQRVVVAVSLLIELARLVIEAAKVLSR